jgi:hypothetical protein
MKHVLLALLMLTAPNGGPVYVPSANVTAVTTANGCDTRSRTVVWTMNGTFCVRETSEQVAHLMEGT